MSFPYLWSTFCFLFMRFLYMNSIVWWSSSTWSIASNLVADINFQNLQHFNFWNWKLLATFMLLTLFFSLRNTKQEAFDKKQMDSGLTNRCDWTFYKSISEKTQSTSRNINYYLKDKWRAAMNNFVTLNKVVFVETLYDGCIYGICWRWNGGHYFCKSRFQPE